MMKTTISKDIDLADAKAGYDTACKQILSNRVVLAWILKSCVDEYRDCSIQDIAEKYILKSREKKLGVLFIAIYLCVSRWNHLFPNYLESCWI